MPNRMIRDGLLTSWRYERLSGDAKLFFYHLMLCADDLGCIELGATFLRRRVLFSTDSDERIAKLIGELTDVDLLRPYQAENRCFGFIPRFRQRVQIKYAKYPQPQECLYADDDDAKQKFQRINNDEQKTTVGQRLPNRSPHDGQHPVSGKREALKTKPATQSADGAATLWTLAVSALCDQGIAEATARGFIGSLLKLWDESAVEEAFRAAIGKANIQAYVRGCLRDKPKKGQRRVAI